MGTVTNFSEYCGRLITQQRRDVRTSIIAAIDLAAGNLELSGTGLRNLVSWMESHEQYELLRPIFDAGLDDAFRLLGGLDEHALAIEILMRQSHGHSMATSTLLRGLVEGVLAVCYLFDAKIPPARAAARMVAFRLDSMEGTERTAVEFGIDMPGEELAQVREAGEGMRELLRDHGFSLVTNKAGFTVAVHFDGEKAPVKINATDAMRKYMPDETYGWWVASGAVHSKGWFLPSFTEGIEEPALSGPEDAIATIVISLLRASEALMETVSAHTGYDTKGIEARTFNRLKAVLAKGRNQSFSPIDIETFQSRGKGAGWTREASKLSAAFIQPGRAYGLITNR